MQFTYFSYKEMIELLRKNNYEIADYHNWKQKEKSVILRHDIDYDIDKAVTMARYEKEMGISSTYFVLVTSDFYNVFSKENTKKLSDIINNGHELGLHFDEVRYCGCNAEGMCQNILNEAEILFKMINTKIAVVSMHRPSRQTLDANLKIPGMINSYGYTFFHEFKYISDSRRHWRTSVEEIIENGEARHLHILMHPFWYFEEEQGLNNTVFEFVNSANMKRYCSLSDNITGLEKIMNISEVS